MDAGFEVIDCNTPCFKNRKAEPFQAQEEKKREKSWPSAKN